MARLDVAVPMATQWAAGAALPIRRSTNSPRWGEFRRAMRCLSGPQLRLVAHVVLGLLDPERRDVATFAAKLGLDEKVCRGHQLAALNALMGHFFADRGAAIKRAIDDLVGGRTRR